MEAQILGKEIVEFIDGTKKEVTLKAISGFKRMSINNKSMTINVVKVNGKTTPQTKMDYSILIKEMLEEGIVEKIDVENLTDNSFEKLFDKYYNPESEENKLKKENLTE